MNVYVVFGECGEYDDHCEWPVRAFLSEVDALTFTLRCNEGAQAVIDMCTARHREKWPDANGHQWYMELLPGDHPLDPAMQGDYTGTQYTCVAIPFDEAARDELAALQARAAQEPSQ